MKINWKVIAIIFIILFCIETFFIGWGFYLVNEEDKIINRCYLDVCEDYPEAYFLDGICSCFDENEEIVKTVYLG